MNFLVGLLGDLSWLAVLLCGAFCIFETLTSEYDRPTLAWRFKRFLWRVFDLLLVHLGTTLMIFAIEGLQRLAKSIRYPRPQGSARRPYVQKAGAP